MAEPEEEDGTNVSDLQQEPETGDERDHGYAWVVMVAVMYMGTLMAGTYVSYGILLPDYVDYFQVNKSQITVIQSMCIIASAVCGVLSGLLTKLYGPRFVVALGSLLATSGFFISGWADNLYVLYITHGILPGIAVACNMTPCVVVLTMYFYKKKALAFSFHSVGLSVAFIIYSPLLRYLLTTYGRRGAMMIYSGLYLNGLVAAALFRPLINRRTKNNPNHEDPVENGKATNKDDKNGCLKAMKNLSFMKDIKFLLYLLSFMFIMGGHVIPYFFIPARIESLNYSKQSAALLLSVLGTSGLLCRPLVGFIGDKLSKQRTLLYSGFGITTGLFTFVSYFLKDISALIVYCVLVGITAAGYSSLHSALVSDLVPLNKVALASGVKFTLSGTTNTIFNLLSGWMVDVTGTYGTPFLVFGLIQVAGGMLGTVVYILQRISSRKQNDNKEHQIVEEIELNPTLHDVKA